MTLILMQISDQLSEMLELLLENGRNNRLLLALFLCFPAGLVALVNLLAVKLNLFSLVFYILKQNRFPLSLFT